jgi:tRNA/rRNA methyltransferase
MKQISIILVNPQMGENIGATARAMLNAGLVDLRLVQPRDGWPNPKADAMASGAIEVLENAKVFETTEEAIADLNFVLATTARLRDMEKETYTPNAAANEFVFRIDNEQKCGVLFGCERSGLSNDDVVLADAVINVPLNPAFSSLNLAQAVLLITYEFYQATLSEEDLSDIKMKTCPAPKSELEYFLGRLEDDLDESGFFSNPEQKPHAMRNIRNMFDRTELSSQEVKTMFGIVKSLKK